MTKISILLVCAMLLTGCIGCEPPPEPLPAYAGIVVLVAPDGMGGGSGVVIAETEAVWYVGTAAHVVGYVDDALMLVDGEIGRVVAMDAEWDVALLEVPKLGQKYRVWQMAEAVQEQEAKAVGWTWPEGLNLDPIRCVYIGHVVSTEWEGCVAFNGGVFPGLSGGALIDRWGRVIGFTSRSPVIDLTIMDSTALFVPVERMELLLDGVRHGDSEGNSES